MVLPPYYLEVILSGGVACIVIMAMYRGGFLWVFFESFSKGPRGLSYVFLITSKVPTLEPVDGLTFVFHKVLVLGGNQEVLMVLLPLKWICMPYLLQIFLMLLHRPWV